MNDKNNENPFAANRQPQSEPKPGGEKRPPEGTVDLDRLRLPQDFGARLGIKKLLTTVPIRRPDKQWFIRVHPDPNWRFPTMLIEAPDTRELYVVEPQLQNEFGSLARFVTLQTAVNRQDTLFLWPLRVPRPDGTLDSWNRSAGEAAVQAVKKWVSVRSNMEIGAYDVFVATGALSEPVWPDLKFEEILLIAFKDRVLASPDHPICRKLRGEI